MRNYIPKSTYIRPEVWKRITSVIFDIDNLKAELDAAPEASRTRAELQRKIDAYDTAWIESGEDVQRLITLKFQKRATYRDMTAKVPMSESTMKREIRRFVVRLGKHLGEI